MSDEVVLNAGDIAAKNDLQAPAPWLWLYEIEVPTDPTVKVRSVGAVTSYSCAQLSMLTPVRQSNFTPLPRLSADQEWLSIVPTSSHWACRGS